MRILSLLFCFLIAGTPAFAAKGPRETLRQFVESDADRNMLTNPGFESGSQDWVLQGPASTFHILNNSTVVGQGLRSYAFVSLGENESVDSTAYEIPRGLWNRNCIASIDYNWSTGTTGDLFLSAIDHAGTEYAKTDLDPVSDYTQKFISFQCPPGGTLKLRVGRKADTTGTIPAIHLDSMYLGRNASTSVDYNVLSPAQSGVRLVSAYILYDDPPTVSVEDGDWIDSLADNGPGDLQINLKSGVFTAAPNCTCTVDIDSTFDCSFREAIDINNINIVTQDTTNGADSDQDLYIICVGAK